MSSPGDLRLRAIAAALRGAPLPPDDEPAIESLIDLAIEHGVAGLLGRSAAAHALPPPVRARLASYAREREVLTAIQDRELARVLDALEAGGVRPLVIKGAHLAHTIYAAPALRPRGDTDLLVAECDRENAARALADAGYTPLVHIRGSVILGQFHFVRSDAVGITHALDVHWRIAAPLLFSDVLPAEALRPRALRIASLGAHAFGPSLADALVLACIHLIAHHRRSVILVWLHDLSVLAGALTTAQQAAFVETAAASRVAAICAHALTMASEYFGNPKPPLVARLNAEATRQREPSERLLTLARPVDELLLDLRTSATWQLRVRLIREHLIPNVDYMRARAARGWLPFAYARRAIAGARGWLAAYDSGRRAQNPRRHDR